VIESLMLCGIGLLAGCLLMLMFFPLVHQRAVRLTTRDIVAATPLAVSEMRADKDLLRAQFAMAVRRLEINVEQMKAKTASQLGEIGKKSVEISDLKVMLDKKTALIFALRAREQVRKSITRRIVKLLLFIFIRSDRRPRVTLGGWQGPRVVRTQQASIATEATVLLPFTNRETRENRSEGTRSATS